MITAELYITKPESETTISLAHTLGHIRGRVIDMDDVGISGCVIFIQETNQVSATDKNGNFVMINIAPAVYTIAVECKGYFPAIFRKVIILPGDNPGFEFVMHRIMET
jgi:hypothetical protein